MTVCAKTNAVQLWTGRPAPANKWQLLELLHLVFVTSCASPVIILYTQFDFVPAICLHGCLQRFNASGILSDWLVCRFRT